MTRALLHIYINMAFSQLPGGPNRYHVGGININHMIPGAKYRQGRPLPAENKLHCDTAQCLNDQGVFVAPAYRIILPIPKSRDGGIGWNERLADLIFGLRGKRGLCSQNQPFFSIPRQAGDIIRMPPSTARCGSTAWEHGHLALSEVLVCVMDVCEKTGLPPRRGYGWEERYGFDEASIQALCDFFQLRVL